MADLYLRTTVVHQEQNREMFWLRILESKLKSHSWKDIGAHPGFVVVPVGEWKALHTTKASRFLRLYLFLGFSLSEASMFVPSKTVRRFFDGLPP